LDKLYIQKNVHSHYYIAQVAYLKPTKLVVIDSNNFN